MIIAGAPLAFVYSVGAWRRVGARPLVVTAALWSGLVVLAFALATALAWLS